jgi:hypothetical protein
VIREDSGRSKEERSLGCAHHRNRVQQRGARKRGRPQAKINVALRIQRHAQTVYALLLALFHPGGRGHLDVSPIVVIGIDDERQLAFGGQEHALASRIARGRQRQADRRTHTLPIPEHVRPIFQSVPITVRQQIRWSGVRRR